MTTKVKTGLIAADAVETANIKDANVTTAKLATDAVTAVKITDATITAAKLAVGVVTLPFNFIGGLKTSTDIEGGDTVHDINIAAGEARDDTNAKDIVLATEITKRIDAPWGETTDAGGMDTGAVANSTLYAVWLILRSDTGVVDALFSTSFTAPTMPTSYDYKRLIGSVKTDGSADIVNFTQSGNYFRYTGDVIADVSDATITSVTYENAALSVPPSCLAHVYAGLTNNTATGTEIRFFLRTKGAADDLVVDQEAWMRVVRGSAVIDGGSMSGDVLVDSISKVEYACLETDGTATVTINTYGFTMFTRTDP
jgi:hypothetical protein